MRRAERTAEARERVSAARAGAKAALGAPGVRLSLTGGAIFCLLSVIAVYVIVEALSLVFDPFLMTSDTYPVYLIVLIYVALFFVASPVLSGFYRMCVFLADGEAPDARMLTAAYGKFSNVCASWCAAAMLSVRWVLPITVICAVAAVESLRVWLWAAIPAALIWMRLFRFLSVFARRVCADPTNMSASGMKCAFVHAHRHRREYTRAAVLELPLLILSLVAVCVPFLFHTLPLWEITAYMLDRE